MIKVNGFEIQREYFPDNTLRLLNFDENVINWPMNQEIDITWLYEGDYEISMLLFITQHIKETFNTYSRIKLNSLFHMFQTLEWIELSPNVKCSH